LISITLICVGRVKESYYTQAAAEYLKRLSGYCNAEVIELSEQRLPDAPSPAQIAQALAREAAAISERVPKGASVVAMCVEGRESDSAELSRTISDFAGRGVSRLCFVIGSSHGLSDTVKSAAVLKLSLSRMTFPHGLARVMLLEQLYRAFKIAEGGSYHK
jgi:23S rRNA (pseudouridine1915-N3)-methyltransferase